MSADYDRLFHSSDPAEAGDDETTTVDPKAVQAALAASATPMPTGTGRTAPPAEPMPVTPTATQSSTPPPRASEVTSQIPPTRAAGPQHGAQPNGMMRS